MHRQKPPIKFQVLLEIIFYFRMSDSDSSETGNGAPDLVGNRLAQIARNELQPVKELAERLDGERRLALEKASVAEAQAEASRLKCLELAKTQKANSTWARQLKIDAVKSKYKSLGDKRAMEYLLNEVSFN